jgi:hypothetical protein
MYLFMFVGEKQLTSAALEVLKLTTVCLRAPDKGSTVNFFLFPRLKSIMKGARFADVAAIQERVTAVL